MRCKCTVLRGQVTQQVSTVSLSVTVARSTSHDPFRQKAAPFVTWTKWKVTVETGGAPVRSVVAVGGLEPAAIQSGCFYTPLPLPLHQVPIATWRLTLTSENLRFQESSHYLEKSREAFFLLFFGGVTINRDVSSFTLYYHMMEININTSFQMPCYILSPLNELFAQYCILKKKNDKKPNPWSEKWIFHSRPCSDCSWAQD